MAGPAENAEQHGDQGCGAADAQEGGGGKRADHSCQYGFQHQDQQGKTIALSGAKQIDQAGQAKGGHGAHGEREEERQGFHTESHKQDKPRTGGFLCTNQIQGENQAEGQQTGGNVGVAENAGNADTGFVSHGLQGIPGLKQGHDPGKTAGKKLQGRCVNAQKGDNSQHAVQRFQKAAQMLPFYSHQNQGKNRKCRQGFGAFPGSIKPKMAPKAGEQTDQGIEKTAAVKGERRLRRLATAHGRWKKE